MLSAIFLVVLSLFGPQPIQASPLVTQGAALVDLDCSDFGVREAASAELGRHSNDVFRLDADRDGTPCEDLPRAVFWTAGGAGLVMLVFLMGELRKQGERGWFEPLILSVVFASVAALIGVVLPKILPRGTSAFVYGLVGAGAAGLWIQFVEKRHK